MARGGAAGWRGEALRDGAVVLDLTGLDPTTEGGGSAAGFSGGCGAGEGAGARPLRAPAEV